MEIRAQIEQWLYADDGMHDRQWLMHHSERCGLIQVLRHRKPPVAIEIGVNFGGSLSVISRHSGTVYGLDSRNVGHDALAQRLRNVVFRHGDSRETLPALLSQLHAQRADLGFALVDGDHSADGVRADMENLLSWIPSSPLWILMHDSMNPECRRGLRATNWAACPYVHYVNLDFVPGFMLGEKDLKNQIWGGLALALMLPEKRSKPHYIIDRAEHNFQVLDRASHFLHDLA